MSTQGRPAQQIEVGSEARERLEKLTLVSGVSRISKRAQVVLLSSAGFTNKAIADELSWSHASVSKWRQRYLAEGIEGLKDEPRSGRKSTPVELSDEERQTLLAWTRSQSMPRGLTIRAQIVLMAADGGFNTQIARDLNVNPTTVRKWKLRFNEDGLEGLHDEARSGRERTYKEEEVAALVRKTLESKPEGATHWSCRTMADECGMSPATVNRIWKLFSLKPHKQKGFKLSTDPFFVDKVVDICGLYLNPPENALVLCVDEKSQCQALERTQPILPMGIGYAEGVTDNYFRHGVTTLFSALNVATGEVQIACKKRHRHQEFLSFLNQLKRNVPDELQVHVVLDNYATHKHEKVKAWIKRNPRFIFHFTPTYSSWMNQVERWFGIITDKAIRRGNFTSVKSLIEKIEIFTEVYNRNPKPFVWAASAEEILDKVGRLCERMDSDIK